MVLADTNVFIDFWNNPTDELTECFEHEDIVICGVVKSELLHGAVSDRDFTDITTDISDFGRRGFPRIQILSDRYRKSDQATADIQQEALEETS